MIYTRLVSWAFAGEVTHIVFVWQTYRQRNNVFDQRFLKYMFNITYYKQLMFFLSVWLVRSTWFCYWPSVLWRYLFQYGPGAGDNSRARPAPGCEVRLLRANGDGVVAVPQEHHYQLSSPSEALGGSRLLQEGPPSPETSQRDDRYLSNQLQLHLLSRLRLQTFPWGWHGVQRDWWDFKLVLPASFCLCSLMKKQKLWCNVEFVFFPTPLQQRRLQQPQWTTAAVFHRLQSLSLRRLSLLRAAVVRRPGRWRNVWPSCQTLRYAARAGGSPLCVRSRRYLI